MPNLLLDIPFDVFYVIGCGWLTIQNVAKLDSAVCNHLNRPELLENLRANVACFNGTYETSGEFMLWLIRRKIKVDLMSITDKCFNVGNTATRAMSLIAFDSTQLKSFYIIDIKQANSLLLTRFFLRQELNCLAKLIFLYCKVSNDTMAVLIMVMIRLCPHLEVLEMTGSVLYNGEHDAIITEAARWCPLLQVVRVGTGLVVTDQAVNALAESCHNLQEFCLPFPSARQVTNESIRHLAHSNCSKKLTAVDLKGCKYLTMDSFLDLCSNCTALVFLYLQGLQINDQVLSAIGEHCPQMENLCLLRSSKMTDAGFGAVCRGCPMIKHVDISEFKLLTISSMGFVFHHLKALKRLKFYIFKIGLLCEFMQAALKIFESFSELDLFYGEFEGNRGASQITINDDSWRPLVEHCSPYDSLNERIELLLDTTTVFASTETITLISSMPVSLMTKIALACKDLQKVRFRDIIWSRDAVWDELVLNIAPLDAAQNTSLVTMDEQITSFFASTNSKMIKTVDMSRCLSLTDEALHAVASSCPELLRFIAAMGHDRDRSSPITDAGVIAVLSSCPSLQLLSVTHCSLLTDVSLLHSLSCREMKVIRMMRCDLVTDSCVAKARAKKGAKFYVRKTDDDDE
jgi:hypothetical protein